MTEDDAILAALPLVPSLGWSRRALPEEARDLFRGPADMIAAFCDLSDRRMEDAAADLDEPRLSRRVKAVIRLRLEQNRPHKETIRRAVGILALPGNAAKAARTTARTVDAIWRAAGDEATGLSWYTKRGILAGVWTSTLLFWLRDDSEDDADTDTTAGDDPEAEREAAIPVFPPAPSNLGSGTRKSGTGREDLAATSG